jgi:hypothetical protein
VARDDLQALREVDRPGLGPLVRGTWVEWVVFALLTIWIVSVLWVQYWRRWQDRNKH